MFSKRKNVFNLNPNVPFVLNTVTAVRYGGMGVFLFSRAVLKYFSFFLLFLYINTSKYVINM